MRYLGSMTDRSAIGRNRAAAASGLPGSVTKNRYVFVTNNTTWVAQTIADIYKSRWQIELFFKWIKQHLKVKRFVGRSKNAVMTQLWVAMCMYLLLSYLKFVMRLRWSLQLQLNMFERPGPVRAHTSSSRSPVLNSPGERPFAY